jgi:hypothetical protein
MDPMQQLQQLKHRTTVDSYITEYESWMQIMKRGRQYLPDDFFIDKFISGLNDSIKHAVQCHCPTSLLRAYWFARQIEKTNNCQPVALRRNLPAAPRNAPIRNAPKRDNQGAMLEFLVNAGIVQKYMCHDTVVLV